MRTALFCLAVILLLSACGTVSFNARREIETISFVEFVTSSQRYDKAVFDPRSGTMYALSRAAHQIDIYRRGQRVNSLGGLGFESYNFQRLADITLDTDGNLLVLDSMAKDIRKFDPSGRMIIRVELSGLMQPELLVMSPDQNLFVYDAAPQEIVCLSALDAKELYRFGRFQLDLPANLSASRDYLVSHSSITNRTQVYYLLGQIKESLGGQVLFDAFNSPISVSPSLTDADATGISFIPFSETPGICSIQFDHICAVQSGGVAIYRILYNRSQR